MSSVNSFLSPAELLQIGFAELGTDVLISRFARVYAAEQIRLGSHVRIDDFCVLSGGTGISIGSFVHISCATLLYGGGQISIGNYSAISSRCALYSQSEDLSGETPVNPMLPRAIRRNVTLAPITLQDHVHIGTGSTLLPGVTLGTGCAIGAHSLVNRSCNEWTFYLGTPARSLKPRSKALLKEMEKLLQPEIPPEASSSQ